MVGCSIINGHWQVSWQWKVTHKISNGLMVIIIQVIYSNLICYYHNLLTMNFIQETEELIKNQAKVSTKSTSLINETIPKFLTILIFLLLTYGHHLQGNDIRAISEAINSKLQLDSSNYQEHLNKTLDDYNLRIKVIEKVMEIYKKAVELDLVLQMEYLNHSISNISQIVQQLDQGLATLESTHTYQQFLERKSTIQKIIQANLTKDSFQEEYDEYTDKFYYSLNNIDNPYDDLENRTNHTAEMAYLAQQEYEKYQREYDIDKYSFEISMCVIVPTRNNVYNNRFIYNVQSILNQNYSNYFLVIVDDNSDDKTGVLIEKYLRRKNISHDKAFVVKNKERQGSLSNIYYAVHNYCRNYTVTLEVDGDDELIGSYVFKLFNAVYQSRNPGFAYSNHVYYAEDEGYISKGYSEAYSKLSIEKQNYRKVIQKFGHLRSFRTDLFFRIAEQDLRDAGGRFFLAAGDEAYVFPMLEMSCRNIEYIDEATYLYNGATGNNVRRAFKQLQEENAVFIRLQKKYSCLPIYQNSLINV